MQELLFVFAFVCFLLAALGAPAGRYSLIGAGLAAVTLTRLLPLFAR